MALEATDTGEELPEYAAERVGNQEMIRVMYGTADVVTSRDAWVLLTYPAAACGTDPDCRVFLMKFWKGLQNSGMETRLPVVSSLAQDVCEEETDPVNALNLLGDYLNDPPPDCESFTKHDLCENFPDSEPE
jgi:hypothetical protein